MMPRPEPRNGSKDLFYPGLNRCMYCGEEDVPLTDEHIIPRSLFGNIILPNATCGSCQKMTSKIETKLTRGSMFEAREVGNYPSYTRHRKNRPRPTLKPMTLIGHDGKHFERDVPAEKRWALMVVPAFAPARWLAGLPPLPGIQLMGNDCGDVGMDLKAFCLEQGVAGVSGSLELDVSAYAQLLAKVAWGMQSERLALIFQKRTHHCLASFGASARIPLTGSA
ncbi:MAG: HNH endonuclease [Solimonas sp.]